MQIQNSVCKDGNENGDLFNSDVQTKLLTKCYKMCFEYFYLFKYQWLMKLFKKLQNI